jgi:hypothetical protein
LNGVQASEVRLEGQAHVIAEGVIGPDALA